MQSPRHRLSRAAGVLVGSALLGLTACGASLEEHPHAPGATAIPRARLLEVELPLPVSVGTEQHAGVDEAYGTLVQRCPDGQIVAVESQRLVTTEADGPMLRVSGLCVER